MKLGHALALLLGATASVAALLPSAEPHAPLAVSSSKDGDGDDTTTTTTTATAFSWMSCNRDPGAVCGFLLMGCVGAARDASATKVRIGVLCGGTGLWCASQMAVNEMACARRARESPRPSDDSEKPGESLLVVQESE